MLTAPRNWAASCDDGKNSAPHYTAAAARARGARRGKNGVSRRAAGGDSRRSAGHGSPPPFRLAVNRRARQRFPVSHFDARLRAFPPTGGTRPVLQHGSGGALLISFLSLADVTPVHGRPLRQAARSQRRLSLQAARQAYQEARAVPIRRWGLTAIRGLHAANDPGRITKGIAPISRRRG
jgi:hypothetical protein